VFCNGGGMLVNCLVCSNSVRYDGGGVFCRNGGVLTNCTVSGNLSGNYGGGVFSDAGGTLQNCIVYSNNQYNGNDIYQDSTTITYSCSPGLSGSGNISSDPKFMNAAAGNYRLLASSPCVNAGANAAWMTNATDLDGNPRLSGGSVDLGAYESQPPQVVITNTTTTVLASQTAVVIGGTNNQYVIGNMTYTNAATGASGSFPAQPSWSTPALALVQGPNTVTVKSTNSAGVIASFNHIRGAWIDQTNSLGSTVLSVSNAVVSGANFRVFGHDGGPLTENTSDLPPKFAWRLDRAWQMEGTGALTGSVGFDCTSFTNLIGHSSFLYLLAATNSTFANATAIPGTYAGNAFWVSGQPLQSGSYYTIGEMLYWTLAAMAGTNGTITPAGDISVLNGGGTNFTITPATYYYVTNVTTNGVSVGAVTGFTWSNVTANGTINATFAPYLVSPTGGWPITA
jgi:hypothetical protein